MFVIGSRNGQIFRCKHRSTGNRLSVVYFSLFSYLVNFFFLVFLTSLLPSYRLMSSWYKVLGSFSSWTDCCLHWRKGDTRWARTLSQIYNYMSKLTHTQKDPLHVPIPAHTHSLRAPHAVRSELVYVKQPVSDFVEEQWNTEFLWSQLLSDQSRSCSLFVPSWSFCVLLHSALTWTNKHSSLVIRTWSVHEVT